MGRVRTRYPFSCTNCGEARLGWRKTSKYCNGKCQMEYEYNNGVRDRNEIVKKAHESVQKYGYPKLKGRPAAWILDEEKRAKVCKKISKTKTGVAVPKLRKAVTKDKSYWKSADYQAWRLACMRRDSFACTSCGDDKGGNLEVDHIKPVYLFPELIHDIDNGRTLCKPCHRETSTWGAQVKKLTRHDFGVV